MRLLAALHHAGATVCMVTHDARFAEHATRVVHVLDGRVVDRDTALAAHVATIETSVQ
jgi:putative ABC transport system ATP-binding protein